VVLLKRQFRILVKVSVQVLLPDSGLVEKREHSGDRRFGVRCFVFSCASNTDCEERLDGLWLVFNPDTGHFSLDGEVAGDICLGKIDEFVTTPRQHGARCIEREILDLLKRDGWRDG